MDRGPHRRGRRRWGVLVDREVTSWRCHRHDPGHSGIGIQGPHGTDRKERDGRQRLDADRRSVHRCRGGDEGLRRYVDSLGGIDGRKIIVDAGNDQFQGGPNKEETQSAVSNDFALVGSFSLEDSFGETVLAANPQVANVSVSLSQSASDLPNTFSVSPVRVGWQLGGLTYFKKLYPSAIAKTGAILSSEPSAQTTWTARSRRWHPSATRSWRSRHTP